MRRAAVDAIPAVPPAEYPRRTWEWYVARAIERQANPRTCPGADRGPDADWIDLILASTPPAVYAST